MTGFLCTLPLMASLFSACAPPPPLAAGYVEGDYVLVAPVTAAQIEQVAVRRGDRIKKGALLAQMEKRDALIAVAMAKAAVAKAQNQLNDLKTGKRPEEIEVLTAAYDAAKAREAVAQETLTRQRDLLRRGIAAQSAYDNALSARDTAKAALAQANAQLAVARLPARPDQIAAAEASLAQAQAGLDQAQWQLDKRTLTASSDGLVFDVIRNPGELAGPQAPVISFLPDGAIKLRLYVPEKALSTIELGSQLAVHCEGCGDGMTATITYVADSPEFTPPVIYSLESRQKLVWLIEARPDAGAARLKPGQIIDADLSKSAQK